MRSSSVADPHHPDPACHFDADPNQDPTFHFDGYPDPDSSFQIREKELK
jgi:hypothetical protein